MDVCLGLNLWEIIQPLIIKHDVSYFFFFVNAHCPVWGIFFLLLVYWDFFFFKSCIWMDVSFYQMVFFCINWYDHIFKNQAINMAGYIGRFSNIELIFLGSVVFLGLNLWSCDIFNVYGHIESAHTLLSIFVSKFRRDVYLFIYSFFFVLFCLVWGSAQCSFHNIDGKCFSKSLFRIGLFSSLNVS